MKNFASCPIFAPFGIAICVLALLLVTSEILPLTWDEGESIDRAEKIRTWLGDRQPLSAASLQQHWVFTTQVEGHPAGYGIVIAVGKSIWNWLPACFSPKTEYRFGPILFFSIAVGVVFRRLQCQFSLSVAVFWVLTVLMIPRLFAHVHIAACDSPLISCWLLTWATFDSAFSQKTSCAPKSPDHFQHFARLALWGICLGLTLSMKFTGWIAILSFCAAVMMVPNRRKNLLGLFLPGLLIALAVFLLLNPPLWCNLMNGFGKFFFLNTSRTGFNISILFLGQMYNLDHPLPWYNTIVWVFITVPFGFLCLGLWGLHALFFQPLFFQPYPGVYHTRISILLNAVILLIVRALPGTPPHDGVRLFVAAFPFLAMIIAIGAARLWATPLSSTKRDEYRPLTGFTLRFCVVLVFASSLFNMYWYSPQWLSYYNAVIGGLNGAQKAGMEPTYYWDSLDREVLGWITLHTNEDELVCFSASSSKNMLLLRQWGELKRDFFRRSDNDQSGKTIRWYVLQRRPSGEYPRDVVLLKRSTPVFRKVIRPAGIGIWRLDDTPLLEIFPFKDYEKTILEEKAE